MKKTLPLCLLALVLGSILGLALGRGLPAVTLPTAPPEEIPAMAAFTLSPAIARAPLDTEDNGPLLDRGQEVLEALKAEDYATLSTLVHPELGVRFTPYSSVDLEGDLVLTPERVAQGGEDTRSYTWGVVDGKGSPLIATIPDYFAQFVFNADYTAAPLIGVDTVLESGNALENVAHAYPEGRFIDYCFPGLEPENEGFDWCSLKLAFQPYQERWYLVGIIHGQWTI